MAAAAVCSMLIAMCSGPLCCQDPLLTGAGGDISCQLAGWLAIVQTSCLPACLTGMIMEGLPSQSGYGPGATKPKGSARAPYHYLAGGCGGPECMQQLDAQQPLTYSLPEHWRANPGLHSRMTGVKAGPTHLGLAHT